MIEAAQQVGLITHYMTLARLLSPSIVVIEDADLPARGHEPPVRGSPAEPAERDGRPDRRDRDPDPTTNRPETLEVALTGRPGRIDQAIEFPLPDPDGRTSVKAMTVFLVRA